jgi:hypothetical protein
VTYLLDNPSGGSGGGGAPLPGSVTYPSLDPNLQIALTPFRNRMMNGGCKVGQRGPVTLPASALTMSAADRFYVYCTGAAAACTNGWHGPKSINALAVNWANAGNTAVNIGQRIPASDIYDLAGMPVTLQGWLYATNSVTPTLVVFTPNAVDNWGAATAMSGAPVLPAIPAGSWVWFAVTFTAPAAATNGMSCEIDFGGLGPTAASFALTNYQLEAGSIATPFEQRPYGFELNLAQQFYNTSYQNGVVAGTPSLDSTAIYVYTQVAQANSYVAAPVCFPTRMFKTPGVTIYNPHTGVVGSGWAQNAAASLTASLGSPTQVGVSIGVNNQAVTAGDVIRFHYTASADL